MNELAHYSPEDVRVTLGGLSISGMIEGRFIVVRREELHYKTKSSADGLPTRSAQNNDLYEVRLYLHSASESNLDLSLIRDADKVSHLGLLPLMISDKLGSTLFFSSTSWVEGEPTVSLGITVEEREWILRCTGASLVVGGNYRVSSGVEDLSRGIFGSASSFL